MDPNRQTSNSSRTGVKPLLGRSSAPSNATDNPEILCLLDELSVKSPSLRAAITCKRSGYMDAETSDKVHTTILKQIFEEAKTGLPGTGPQFSRKPVYGDGALKLWCDNNRTLDWLKNAVSKVSLPEHPNGFVVKRQCDLNVKKRVRADGPKRRLNTEKKEKGKKEWIKYLIAERDYDLCYED